MKKYYIGFIVLLIMYSTVFAESLMLVSDRDPSLAINAWNGAKHGAELRLHDQCEPNNPDCTWTYRNGMLVSDRDPSLAINAWNGAKHGAELRLHDQCEPSNPDCTWTYRNGMLVSDRDPSLAINAWNGAKHGAKLKLHVQCQSSNPDCTWKKESIYLSVSNELFDLAEIIYPQYFSPYGKETFQIDNYLARYYENTDTYIGTLGEDVFVYGNIFDGLKKVGQIHSITKSLKSAIFSSITGTWKITTSNTGNAEFELTQEGMIPRIDIVMPNSGLCWNYSYKENQTVENISIIANSLTFSVDVYYKFDDNGAYGYSYVDYSLSGKFISKMKLEGNYSIKVAIISRAGSCLNSGNGTWKAEKLR